MNIAEPSTLVTDCLLSAVSFGFALLLWRSIRNRPRTSAGLWAGAFFASALTALIGGTYHGFGFFLGTEKQNFLWKVTVHLAGVLSLLMLPGSLMATVKGSLRRGLLLLAVLKFLAYSIWMLGHEDFRYVIYDYLPAMAGILALHSYRAFKEKDANAGWMVGGILVSFFAAFIQQSGLSMHKNFNHNDLYHVIQIGATYLLYRGARRLEDRNS
jgi:hypothetical protein